MNLQEMETNLDNIFKQKFDVEQISDRAFLELICVASGLTCVKFAFERGTIDLKEQVYYILKNSDRPNLKEEIQDICKRF